MEFHRIDKFWEKVDKNGPMHDVLGTRCWKWMGSKNQKGYGRFWTGERVEAAHRFSWVIAGGTIKKDDGYYGTELVCHKCDNPKCVRPSHLFTGTYKDNAQDMMSKNRGPHSNNTKVYFCETCECEFVGVGYYNHILTCNGHVVCTNCGSDDLYTRGQGVCKPCYMYRLRRGKERPTNPKICITCGADMGRYKILPECNNCHSYRNKYGKQRPEKLIKHLQERKGHDTICANCGIEPYRARGLCKRCYNYKRMMGKPRPSHLWGVTNA